MGNVMVDIARWLMVDSPKRSVDEVIVIARRGPLEAKFDDKEFANIQIHLDRKTFQDELRRVEPAMKAVGQDIAKVAQEAFTLLAKHPDQQTIPPHLTFRFLSSPSALSAGPDGRVAKLTVAENILVPRDGGLAAKATNQTADIDVDTLIFAIGDQHDPALGLPYADGYVTNSDPADAVAKYQVFDPAAGKVCAGDFVVGWARKPSDGLVGIARHDGEVGAAGVLQFLESAPIRGAASAEDIGRFLAQKGIQAVPKADLPWLTAAEEREARLRGTAYYFFPDDNEMLSEIEQEKSRSTASAAP
jgi:ferredoxin/flavodoxin---NADP+ reductase